MSDNSNSQNETPEKADGKKSWVMRLALLALVGAMVAAFSFLDLSADNLFDQIYVHRTDLQNLITEWGILALVAYALVYAASTALSLPTGSILTVLSGFLFGTIEGGLSVIVGATLGAVIIFQLCKSAFGDSLRDKAGPFIRKMQDGFAEDALSYMLVLRLVPLFPFWVVNIVPAFLNVPLRLYTMATLFGIAPATFVFAQIGTSLDSLFAACDAKKADDAAATCGAPSFGDVLTLDILLALLGLAALSLIPVIHKKIKARKAA